MPIVKAKPTAPTPVITNPPKVVDKPFDSPLVDTKYTPLSSLITFVEGYNWTVDYYSQVIGKDSQLQGQDPSLPKQYQQYKLIKALELKAENPITWNQDTVTKSFTAQGTSTMHSTLIANKGDMFVADVGDGRLGVFEVNTTTKKSLMAESVYSLEYTLIYFVDEYPNKKADLDNKVVQTLHYARDLLAHGQAPVITTQEYNTIEQLHSLYNEIVDNYMNWFYSRETKTLLVPNQETMVYDSFVASFVSKLLNTDDHKYVRELILLNCGDDDVLLEDHLYKALEKKSPRTLEMANRYMGVTSARSFSANPLLASIRMTRVSFVVYPKGRQETPDSNFNSLSSKVVIDFDYLPSKTRPGDISTIITDNVIDHSGVANRPVIKPIHENDTYVFSNAFYKNEPVQSLLEILVLNFINDRHNSPKDIYDVSSRYHNWGAVERFYYLPILLCLIKSVIRRF